MLICNCNAPQEVLGAVSLPLSSMTAFCTNDEEHINDGGTNELYSSMGRTVRESGWKSGKKSETKTFNSM